MKIFILNDTSRCHAGSRQCMEYIYDQIYAHTVVGKHYCGEKIIPKSYYEADLVICNGEGTMHDNVDKSVFLLHCLGEAQTRKKKTMLVNSLWFNMYDFPYITTLQGLDYCCVREIISYKNITRHAKVKCEIVPDFCMSAYGSAVRNRPGTTTAKGETHPDCLWHGIMDYIKADETIFLTGNFKDVVRSLTRHKKYITGQHHGVYAAILAGIDFLALPSNTPKIESLIKWIGGKDPYQFLVEKWEKFSLKKIVNAL